MIIHLCHLLKDVFIHKFVQLVSLSQYAIQFVDLFCTDTLDDSLLLLGKDPLFIYRCVSFDKVNLTFEKLIFPIGAGKSRRAESFSLCFLLMMLQTFIERLRCDELFVYFANMIVIVVVIWVATCPRHLATMSEYETCSCWWQCLVHILNLTYLYRLLRLQLTSALLLGISVSRIWHLT